jgi:heme-degrading monooxygenase HmoA
MLERLLRNASESTIGRRVCLQNLLTGMVGFFSVSRVNTFAKEKHQEASSVELHMYIQVKTGQAKEFENRYRTVYLPIVQRQKGFRSSRLLRKRDSQDYYEIDLAFDSEALRATWASSQDHDRAWNPMGEVIAQITVQGFDVLA